jgi:hypothetical protein
MECPWIDEEPLDLPRPSRAEFLAGRRRRFGWTNPDLIEDPF